VTSADYSLQLASTVTRAISTTQPTFNPCTWDAAAPPQVADLLGARLRGFCYWHIMERESCGLTSRRIA
jgi:hypothetical protein